MDTTGGGDGTARELPGPGVSPPVVALPTVLLFAGGALVWALATWLVLTAGAPLWLTVPLHTLVTVTMFTVVHEAVHHSVGRLTSINAVLGRLAMPFVAAYAAFPAFRHMHLEHHRDPGGPSDPVTWTTGGPRWQASLRWLTADFWLCHRYLSRAYGRPGREVHEGTMMAIIAFVALGSLAVVGHGWEVLVIYLVPHRLGICLVVWLYDWLPHRGLECRGAGRATGSRVRVGADRLVTALTLAQNHHPVHHLHPAIPFYRYRQVWRRNVEHYLDLGVPITTLGGRPLDAGQYRRSRWYPPAPSEQPSAEPRPRRLRMFHTLPIVRIETLTADSVSISFGVPDRLADAFRFLPGQHVTVRALVDGVPLRRCYALLPPRQGGEIRIAVKRVDGGPFSTFATTQLRAGGELDVLPPSGEFTLEPEPRRSRHYVGLAAGSGLPPILTMFATALEFEPHSQATLLYVNRDRAAAMLTGDLTELARRFDGRLRVVHYRTDVQDPDLHVNTTRTAMPFDPIGEVLAVSHETYVLGRPDIARLEGLLDGRLHPAKVDEWFVSAPPALAAETLRLLAENDVPAAAVQHEDFRFGDDRPVPETPVPLVLGELQ